jgi:hypothetical protein
MQGELLPANTPEMSLASSVVPYPYDDLKGKFLRFRALGFSNVEACRALGIGKSVISEWRGDDIRFLNLESRIPEFRKELAMDWISMQFARNMALAMLKDQDVLLKATNPRKIMTRVVIGGKVSEKEVEMEIPMSEQDHEYLKKMRGIYTPEQLEKLKEAVMGDSEGLNWSKLISEISKRKGSVSITQTVKVSDGG